jgi:hypothetical protein
MLVTIQSVSLALDDLGGPRPPKLITIDSVGHESEVIASATVTLKSHFPVLVVECFDRDALVTLRSRVHPA